MGEPTLGDHLPELGVNCTLVGKTRMTPDKPGMARLGIEPDGPIGARVSECGFDVFVRDDGTNHSDYPRRHSEDYDAYLREHGFDGDNPWEEWANSAEGPDGELLTGWLLKNSRLPARVPAEHSETAWLTTRGIEFIEQQGDDPLLCHLSYIKPHWPYLAPAPYNDMYGPDDLPPVNRTEAERETDHPLMQTWVNMRVSQSFSRDEVRDVAAPADMGLIKQLDDELGRLFDYLEASGRFEDTMIVFCSDHGDNMGDHWMGEKDLFFDCSARMPLIVYDPRPEADATRGEITDALVESIDLVPTFLDYYKGEAKPYILEGRSLQPLLHKADVPWRDYAFSEYDCSTRESRLALGLDQKEARMAMVFDGRWKYVHVEHFRPMLFDLESDAEEVIDLATNPAFADQVARVREVHFDWTRQHHSRITLTAEQVDAMANRKEPPGIIIGFWDADELKANGLDMPGKASG